MIIFFLVFDKESIGNRAIETWGPSFLLSASFLLSDMIEYSLVYKQTFVNNLEKTIDF